MSYVILRNKDLYSLYHVGTLYCLSSSPDLEVVKRTLKRVVKKYKTSSRVDSAIRSLEDYGVMSVSYKEHIRERICSGEGREFEGVVKKVLKEVEEEVKSSSPLHRVLTRPKKPRLGTITSRPAMEEVSLIKSRKSPYKKKPLLRVD